MSHTNSIIVVFLVVAIYLFRCYSHQETTPVISDTCGYGAITNANICEEKLLKRHGYPIEVKLTDFLELEILFSLAISFSASFLAVLTADDGTDERGNDKLRLLICELCIVSFVFVLVLAIFIPTLKKINAVKKIDDWRPRYLTHSDLNEGSVLETLPLHKLARLRNSLDTIPTTKGMKYGKFDSCFIPPELNHFMQFRREERFTQKLTVCPAVSLASHFASGAYGQPNSAPELNKEGVRLTSFKDFPTSVPVSAIRLAQAGFFFTRERDQVKCFSCGVTYQGWRLGDRPALVHARISPNCPLVRGSDTTNTPLPLPITNRPNFAAEEDISEGASVRNPTPPNETAGSNEEEVQTDAMQTQTDATSRSSQVVSVGYVAAATANAPVPSSLATPENSMYSGAPLHGQATPMDGGAPRNLTMPRRRLDLNGSVYPLYSQMDARKRSFSSWPGTDGLPSVEVLTGLGFFFAGYADCVRCFFCGIGLKSWEPGDIPAEVHARWRPTCEYLRLVKGDAFVDRVANSGRGVPNSAQTTNQSVSNQTQTGEQTDGEQLGQSNTQAPANSQGTPPTVPDRPVVQRARESGYTEEQIAEAVAKLRVIGMEAAMDVMLVEILTNLFSNTASQPSSGAGSTSNGNSNADETDGAEVQTDGAQPDNVPDNGGEVVPAGDQRVLEARHNELQQENARLRDMRTCQRCHDQPVGVIFLPCGHIISCTVCAPNIRRCLRCDTVIRATANVFFS